MGIQDTFSDDEIAHLIFDNSPNGSTLHEIVVDDEGQPIDYIFLKVNHAFEELTSLRAAEIIGRRVTEVLPGIEHDPFISIYGQVALTGAPVIFEQFSTSLNKYYDITAFSPRKGLFATFFTDITQRKQEKEALKEALEKYRLIFENAREGISIYEDFPDGSRVLIECNHQYAEMSGYSREELIQISHNTPQQETKNQKKILSGQPFTGIFSWIRPDEEENYIDYTAVPLDINGKKLTIGIVDHNITERKQAEETLIRSEQLYRNAIESAGAVPYLRNFITGEYEFVGENIKSLTGYSAEELTPKLWESITTNSIIHGQYEGLKFAEAFDKAKSEKSKNFWLDLAVKTRDGEERWLFDSSVLIYDEQGNLIKSLGILQDITMRKHNKELLKESEEKYRSFVENLNDIIFTVDMEGYITYISPVVSHIGYTPDEIIGKQFSQFIALEDLPGLMSSFENALKGKVEPYEFRILDKDGKGFYVHVSSRPIMKNGQMTGFAGILTDITQQRKLEEQLRQAQKMEAIGQLAGGVAHDFNNLLQVISGYSEVVLSRVDDSSSIHPYIEEIIGASERATSLTRQLLAFSRRQMIQLQVLSVNDIIGNISKMLKRLIGEDIEFTTVLSPDIMQVKADPGQIEQVIMNLAVNARDAMPEGGMLTIKTENVTIDENQSRLIPESLPGEYVYISVSDTGVGMSRETIQRIFEPFFSTKGIKGTGLGLSVVYGIVKQHDGWINIYSEPGQGSVFKIYLPAIPEKHETKSREIIPQKDIRGCEERILLVEDEHQVLVFARQVLQEHGYVVFEAPNIKEATEVFEREGGNIHLIFSDVVLTDGTGIQLVEKLLSINPNIHVLLSSGYTDQKSQWQDIQDRKYSFIQKPYKISDMLKAIKEAAL